MNDVERLLTEWIIDHGPEGGGDPVDAMPFVVKARDEILRLRDKQRQLHRRCQRAEAAAADAMRCIDKMAQGGTPWVGGSLGRAAVVWDNERKDRTIAALRAQLAKAVDAANR